jgi:hypothetical protein
MFDSNKDETEALRRQLIEQGIPYELAAKAERLWDTDQVRDEFDVLGFMAPFVAVVRKSDGVKGSLMFTHSPRYYFNFEPVE